MAKATLEYDDEFPYVAAYVPWDESNVGVKELDVAASSNADNSHEFVDLIRALIDAGVQQFGE